MAAALVRIRAIGFRATALVPHRGFASALEGGKDGRVEGECKLGLSIWENFTKFSINPGEIKKSVFISQSYDIFTNLALEDWIYRNFDFKNHHVLMLWSNNPCVVIGRHQNPWVESNISALERNGVVLARRNSGGGTVYHDRGNLNCTFFTPRDRYNRKYNLNLITRALFREWSIKADISDRDDILFRGKKVRENLYLKLRISHIIFNDKKSFQISGTAAKLGQPNAYHHCTLLVNTNKDQLTQALVMEKVSFSRVI